MTLEAEIRSCIVCGSAYDSMGEKIFHCPQCGLLHSNQKAGFGNPIRGMTAIAMRNYAIVANVLQRAMPLHGAKILDVGCAEGGFTGLMLSKGANCLGLEPDSEASREAIDKKMPIELINFESFKEEVNEYDVIVFNDVFEHIQDPIYALEKSCRLLKCAGYILINAPVSSGLIFRMVTIAAMLGIESPYRRIWADGLCSPHIYFYDEGNLKTLLSKYEFKLVDSARLVSLAGDGMYQRVRSTYGPLSALIISVSAIAFSVISNIFPADVRCFLFKRNE
jgi:SAM-dependent methyltransferase